MIFIKDIKQKIINDLSLFVTQLGFVFHDGAWYADSKDLIKVIQIQHFTTDLARSFKTNTATFNVNLGVYYKFFIERNESQLSNSTNLLFFPKEYECHIRRCLLRDFNQDVPNKKLNQIDKRRKDIWYVNDDSSNLDIVIEGVKRVLAKEGIKWFNQFSDLSYTFKFIKSSSEGNAWEGKPFSFGARNSPIRRKYIKDFSSRLEIGNKKGVMDKILSSIKRQKIS